MSHTQSFTTGQQQLDLHAPGSAFVHVAFAALPAQSASFMVYATGRRALAQGCASTVHKAVLLAGAV